MISFPEFLIEHGEFKLFEGTSFCQEIMDKLTPSEQAEFVEFIKNSDAENIMRMIKQVKGDT
jgi:hypothetical protein